MDKFLIILEESGVGKIIKQEQLKLIDQKEVEHLIIPTDYLPLLFMHFLNTLVIKEKSRKVFILKFLNNIV